MNPRGLNVKNYMQASSLTKIILQERKEKFKEYYYYVPVSKEMSQINFCFFKEKAAYLSFEKGKVFKLSP